MNLERVKNVQLYGYTKNNLGDDMFIVSFVKTYPNIQFYINVKSEKFIVPFQGIDNLIVNICDNTLNVQKLNNIDACVYIAGSIFIEKGNALQHQKNLLEYIIQCKNHNIPYYFISSNYGPFHTQEYFDISTKIFNSCADICFRDNYSYNLFSQIENVRYAPDYLFGYDFKMYSNGKNKNTIGISVIDMDIREDLHKYENTYIDFLCNNIITYINQGLNVSLISFCEYEGDTKCIDKILERLPFNYSKLIEKLCYTGNIHEFLTYYSKLEYMLCTRFHSMVSSIMLGQKTYCLSYSKKLDNVISDLRLYNEYARLNEICENQVIDLNKYTIVDNENANCIANDSKKQLRAFEVFINT